MTLNRNNKKLSLEAKDIMSLKTYISDETLNLIILFKEKRSVTSSIVSESVSKVIFEGEVKDITFIEIEFEKVDVRLAYEFKIRYFPTIMFFRKSQLINEFSGVLSNYSLYKIMDSAYS